MESQDAGAILTCPSECKDGDMWGAKCDNDENCAICHVCNQFGKNAFRHHRW